MLGGDKPDLVLYGWQGLGDDKLLAAVMTDWVILRMRTARLWDFSGNYLSGTFVAKLLVHVRQRWETDGQQPFRVRVIDFSNNYLSTETLRALYLFCGNPKYFNARPHIVVVSNPCAGVNSRQLFEDIIEGRLAVGEPEPRQSAGSSNDGALAFPSGALPATTAPTSDATGTSAHPPERSDPPLSDSPKRSITNLRTIVWIPPLWLPGRNWTAMLENYSPANHEYIMDTALLYWEKLQITEGVPYKAHHSYKGIGCVDLFRGPPSLLALDDELIVQLDQHIAAVKRNSVFLRICQTALALGQLHAPFEFPGLLALELASRYKVGRTFKADSGLQRGWYAIAAQLPSILTLVEQQRTFLTDSSDQPTDETASETFNWDDDLDPQTGTEGDVSEIFARLSMSQPDATIGEPLKRTAGAVRQQTAQFDSDDKKTARAAAIRLLNRAHAEKMTGLLSQQQVAQAMRLVNLGDPVIIDALLSISGCLDAAPTPELPRDTLEMLQVFSRGIQERLTKST